MSEVVTLRERRARSLAARQRALDEAKRRLALEAARLGGRYLVHGSAARGAIHPDSDIDLLADFPRDRTQAAIRAAEEVCRELGLPCDVIDLRGCRPGFSRQALSGSLALQ